MARLIPRRSYLDSHRGLPFDSIIPALKVGSAFLEGLFINSWLLTLSIIVEKSGLVSVIRYVWKVLVSLLINLSCTEDG